MGIQTAAIERVLKGQQEAAAALEMRLNEQACSQTAAIERLGRMLETKLDEPTASQIAATERSQRSHAPPGARHHGISNFSGHGSGPQGIPPERSSRDPK